jgi:photosystem II stability/assembly factor-like uncharacterized protein
MAVLRRFLLAALASVVLVALPLGAQGADNQWVEYGALPAETPSFSLAVDPAAATTVMAATQGAGLLRTDDGKTWRDIGSPVLPKFLWKVAVDARPDSNGYTPIYVGSAGHGFYRSLDGGRTWKEGNSGLSGRALNVRSIALGHNLIVIGTSDGAFKSADNGSSWLRAGLTGFDVSAVAFAVYGTAGSSAEPVVLAGIDSARNPGSRLARSTDLGNTWAPLKGGLPAEVVVSSLVAGPVPSGANLRPLFMSGSGGVYKSDDGGDNWAQLAGLPQGQGFGTVVTSPYDANLVYAASDGGGNSGSSPAPGTGGGVWRSTDRGGTWSQVIAGLTHRGVTALAVARNSPGTLYVATFDPDQPSGAATAYAYTDAQAALSGTPEEGVCPSAAACTGDLHPLPAVEGIKPAPVILHAGGCVAATARPTPTTGGSAQPAAASPSPSPATSAAAAGASPVPSPSPSCAPSAKPTPNHRARNDLPIELAAGVVGLLLLVLVSRIFLARR